MRTIERKGKSPRNYTNILDASFLDEDFVLEDFKEGNMCQAVQELSDATYLKKIEPCQMKIYSLTGERDYENDLFHIILIDPDYADIRMIVNKDPRKAYFQKGNGNIGCIKLDYLRNLGMTEKQLREIEEIGFFLQYKGDKKLLTLIPSKAFLATLCRQLGIGKVNGDEPDPIRDVYLASRLRKTDEFSIIYRKNQKGYGKVFGCFSPKFAYVPQNIIFEFMEELSKMEGVNGAISIRKWKITHFYTVIDFIADDLVENINGVKITPGFRLTLSDVGDSSYTIESTLCLCGGVVLFNDKTIRRHTGTLDVQSLVKAYNRNFKVLIKAMNRLHKGVDVPVSSRKEATLYLLKKIQFNVAFGIRNAIAFKGKYVENRDDEKCSETDVLLDILKIPGIIQTSHKKEAVDSVSIAVGQVFGIPLKEEYL